MCSIRQGKAIWVMQSRKEADTEELQLVASVEQYLEMFSFSSSSFLFPIPFLASALSLSLCIVPKDSTTVDNNSTEKPYCRSQVWREKPGQYWALLTASRDSAHNCAQYWSPKPGQGHTSPPVADLIHISVLIFGPSLRALWGWWKE